MDDYGVILGKEVYNREDERLGMVDSLYMETESGEPVFVAVTTDWIASNIFVPLEGAEMTDDRIIVPYTKDQIVNAPKIEQEKELSTDEEDRLYTHYGLIGNDEDDEMDDEDDDEDYVHEEEGDYPANGHDTSGPNTDEAMTRSEEELKIGKRTHETGRYRLRKYVVTDNVTKTVPVEREEVRVEREPITDENRDAAMSGPDISDEEHEVVTHAETPTIDKSTVPKERFKLNKETVNDEETVNEDVRKEQVDLEKDDER